MPRKNEYHWVFGNNVHLEFQNGGNPILIPPPTGMDTDEGCATISDLSTGNLLFYTDGIDIWDSTAVQTTPQPSLGGDPSATHSAIIVPPAGGGNAYHVITTHEYQNPLRAQHHLVDATGTVTSSTTNNPIAPWECTERLAATTHVECDRYWVAMQKYESQEFSVALIDNDNGPLTYVPSLSDAGLDNLQFDPRGQMKFSPDAKWLAVAYFANPDDDKFPNAVSRVSIYAFNNATGVLTRKYVIGDLERPWGVEFSPDSQLLYFTDHQVSQNSTVIYAADFQNFTNTSVAPGVPEIRIVDQQNITGDDGVYSALQLGPNNKIYSTVQNKTWLAEIGNPNNFSAPNFAPVMLGPNNKPFEFHDKTKFSSIPTFTRIADKCLVDHPKGDCCKSAIDDVNDELSHDAKDDFNSLPTCEGQLPDDHWECLPLDLPNIEPHVSITWGSSKCECLESDDVEIMNITICNPYSNITMSNVVIPRLEVTMNGQPVPTLPDGSPSVRIVPRGPICFGDIEGCQCVTREFVMENRGAKAGKKNPYKIEIENFCFGVSFCNESKACFEFTICKDN